MVVVAEDVTPRTLMRPSAQGLRLAIFTDTFEPQANGVSTTLAQLARTIRARGGDVRVFTAADPDAPRHEDQVVRVPSLPFRTERHLRIAVPARGRILRDLERWQPTLVHAATLFAMGLAGRHAAHALGIPLVTWYHPNLSGYSRRFGLGLIGELGWRYLRWFHGGARRTYCASHLVSRELRARGFGDVRVWSPGVDTARFAPWHRSRAMRLRLGATDDSLIVAYVGRLAAEKGLAIALDGMRLAARELPTRFTFAFAGDGPLTSYCLRQAPPRSSFLGRIFDTELAAFYASADLLVSPSTSDTFGNVIREALASGLAVLAADTGSTRELLTAASGVQSGVLYDARAPESLGSELIALAFDGGRRIAMGRTARAAAVERSEDSDFDALIEDYVRLAIHPVAEEDPGLAAVARPSAPADHSTFSPICASPSRGERPARSVMR